MRWRAALTTVANQDGYLIANAAESTKNAKFNETVQPAFWERKS